MKEKLKSQRGITLIALIITIIILLILAMVSVNVVIHNGIIDKTKEGVSKYKEEEQKEMSSLNNLVNNYLSNENQKLSFSLDEFYEYYTNHEEFDSYLFVACTYEDGTTYQDRYVYADESLVEIYDYINNNIYVYVMDEEAARGEGLEAFKWYKSNNGSAAIEYNGTYPLEGVELEVRHQGMLDKIIASFN